MNWVKEEQRDCYHEEHEIYYSRNHIQLIVESTDYYNRESYTFNNRERPDQKQRAQIPSSCNWRKIPATHIYEDDYKVAYFLYVNVDNPPKIQLYRPRCTWDSKGSLEYYVRFPDATEFRKKFMLEKEDYERLKELYDEKVASRSLEDKLEALSKTVAELAEKIK